MPYAIDQEALDSPNTKIMDLNKPPIKSIPYQEYPKMVYLHPKDKTREHQTKIVHTVEEKDAALSKGYRLHPHIPQEKPLDLSADFEVETPEPRRGPGRPKNE